MKTISGTLAQFQKTYSYIIKKLLDINHTIKKKLKNIQKII